MRLESLAIVFLVSVSAAATAVAAPPPSARLVLAWRPGVWAPAMPAAPAAGMRIALDPVTGELTELPSADPALEGARLARLSGTAPFVVEHRADGSQRVVLGGRLRAYALARVGPDGRLEFDCQQGTAPVLTPAAGEDR